MRKFKDLLNKLSKIDRPKTVSLSVLLLGAVMVISFQNFSNGPSRPNAKVYDGGGSGGGNGGGGGGSTFYPYYYCPASGSACGGPSYYSTLASCQTAHGSSCTTSPTTCNSACMGTSCQSVVCPTLTAGCTYGTPVKIGTCTISCGPVACPANTDYSQDWSAAVQAIFSSNDNPAAFSVARTAGLQIVLVSGDITGEAHVDLNDPVTGSTVVTIMQDPQVTFSNVSGSSLTSNDTDNVCAVDGAYFWAYKDKNGNAHLSSVLTEGLTAITLNFTNVSGNLAKLDYMGACNQAATGLGALGLTVTCQSGLPTNQFVSGQVNFSCTSVYNIGLLGYGTTHVDKKTGNVQGKVLIGCDSSELNQASLANLFEHETLHTLGAPHDAGIDIMDYLYEYSNMALPAGFAQAAKDITSTTTNVNIDASKNCMKYKDYAKLMCSQNPNWGTWTGPNGKTIQTFKCPKVNATPTPSPSASPTGCTNFCANGYLNAQCECVTQCTCCPFPQPATCSGACGNTNCNAPTPTPTPGPTPDCSSCTCGSDHTYSCNDTSCAQQGQTCSSTESCVCSCNGGTYSCTPPLDNPGQNCTNNGTSCQSCDDCSCDSVSGSVVCQDATCPQNGTSCQNPGGGNPTGGDGGDGGGGCGTGQGCFCDWYSGGCEYGDGG